MLPPAPEPAKCRHLHGSPANVATRTVGTVCFLRISYTVFSLDPPKRLGRLFERPRVLRIVPLLLSGWSAIRPTSSAQDGRAVGQPPEAFAVLAVVIGKCAQQT